MTRKQLKEKLKVVESREISCFPVSMEDGAVVRVEFYPVDNLPGYSHRVVVNGQFTQKWARDLGAPNQTRALQILYMKKIMENPVFTPDSEGGF